ncbi:MAG: hypothetical protein ABI954_07415 [Pyrinomonadaceae bacterium]
MLIDDLMPKFEFGDTNKIDVNASPNAVFRAVKTFNMGDSTTVRWLFKMRGIPTENLTINDFEKANFKVLAEKRDEEILLGLIGEFKSLTSGLLKIEPDKFRDFNNAGFIKAVWNFAVAETSHGKSRLTTEIRIHPTDASSMAKIKTYWGMLRPPSQMIRKEILKLIKKQAEREAKGK